MALSNEELMLRAEALGFSTATDEGRNIIFLKGETRWRLQLQISPSVAAGPDRWLLIVNGSAQIRFYPEDALRFLMSQRRSSR